LLLGIGETRVAASSPFEVQHGHDPPATRQEHDDLFASVGLLGAKTEIPAKFDPRNLWLTAVGLFSNG
jgi:hypothetical protein